MALVDVVAADGIDARRRAAPRRRARGRLRAPDRPGHRRRRPRRGRPLPAVEGFANREGLGVEGVVDGHAVVVGRPRCSPTGRCASPPELDAAAAARRSARARPPSLVGWDGARPRRARRRRHGQADVAPTAIARAARRSACARCCSPATTRATARRGRRRGRHRRRHRRGAARRQGRRRPPPAGRGPRRGDGRRRRQRRRRARPGRPRHRDGHRHRRRHRGQRPHPRPRRPARRRRRHPPVPRARCAPSRPTSSGPSPTTSPRIPLAAAGLRRPRCQGRSRSGRSAAGAARWRRRTGSRAPSPRRRSPG